MLWWIFESLGLAGSAVVFLVGMLALDKLSDLTVENAVKVAELTRVGKMTVGFLLISTFTTLPELSVSVFSIVDPEAIGVAIGNVLGSNIVNICLILGLCILILSLMKPRKTYHLGKTSTKEIRNLYFGLFIASLIPLILVYIGYAGSIIGSALITIYIIHVIQLIRSENRKEERSLSEEDSVSRPTLLTILGAIGVVSCAFFIVESATFIAETLGIPKVVIGATIVAFGTSLPELVNGINATRKGHIELTLGNIIGSGFVNITLILGVTLLVGQFRVNMVAYSNLATFSIVANLILWYFLSGERIGWREGALLLFIYILFIVTSFGAR
ncbi:MAG: sodium:calcium antiporter [Candidatus Bathyarchaeia archaeon]